MSDIDHSRDCVLPSDGRAEGLVRASEFFALAAERDRLTAEVERLRAALGWYADRATYKRRQYPDEDRCYPPLIEYDGGEKARAALSPPQEPRT